jgi:diphosphomevalonate decarboxylase
VDSADGVNARLGVDGEGSPTPGPRGAGTRPARPLLPGVADDVRGVGVKRATAYAHTNIALVKYWGKRPARAPGLNLPAVGSLSLTLDRFGTETTVAPADDDTFVLDGHAVAPHEAAKVFAFLDRVRTLAGSTARAQVTSRNDVPTAAGLASSASAFAALARAATTAWGVDVDDRALSQLARQGSGSAARSIFGGFVLLHRGVRDDGDDCYAEALPTPAFAARLVVVRCGEGRKDTGSTDGMDLTAATSPYFRAWVDTHEADLRDAQDALAAGDLPRLGEVMEHSTLKMHATTLGARPGFFYFQPATIAVLLAVRGLRARGTGAWATMDAGPHVKVLCAAVDVDAVVAALAAVPGVRGVDVAAPGPAVRVAA